MTIKELKELIANIPDDHIVILATDGEGNGYSPLDAVDDTHVYIPNSTWSGDVGYDKLTSELIEQGFTDADVYEDTDAKKAVILWPVN